MAENNYVVGRGEIFFDQFITGTQTKTGERYLGNTPSLAMTATYTNLDHYSSEHGIQVKDASVQLRRDRSGTFTCDNISMDNVALMFGATATVDVEAGELGASESFDVQEDRYYQLGVTDDTPDGASGVSNVVVTDSSGVHAFGTVTFTTNPSAADTITINGEAITFRASAPAEHEVLIVAGSQAGTAQNFLTEINAYPNHYDVTASGAGAVIQLTAILAGTGGNSITMTKSGTNPTLSAGTLASGSASSVITITDNYEVDEARGRIHILTGAPDIANGDTVEVEYDIAAGSRNLVVDEQNQVEGALRFLADNAVGTDKDYYWPRVKVTPSGEYALKSDTWMVMTFNFEVLQPSGGVKPVYVREAV